MKDTTAAREARARRRADRMGMRLIKSRTRNPDILDYGLYGLIDTQTGFAISEILLGRYVCSLSLEEVEDQLT